MARPLRVEFPGAVYHLTSRGNARQRIFFDDEDRQTFLLLLAQVMARYAWCCHAFCLMDNHYHLLIETLQPSLSRGMRQLNGVFTQRVNQRHGRVGHVFQGRFTAILVERDTHLLELCRYVVLNPVRARLVERPDDWLWSSYRATAGLAPRPSWLTTDWVLNQFGPGRRTAQRAYVQFVREGLHASSPWGQVRGQIYLGSEAFCRQAVPTQLQETLQVEIPREQQRPVRPSLEELFGEATERTRQVVEAYYRFGYQLGEIADHFRVHYTTISRWLRAAEAGVTLPHLSPM